MRKSNLKAVFVAVSGGLAAQAGCVGFWQREIEALVAPAAFGNALFVLDSVLFDLLAPLFY